MSEPRGQLRKEHLTFPGCSHFRRLDDNHEKCQSCMYGGAPGCTRLSRCHFCADWTSSMWDAEEKKRQAAVKRRIRKKDKKASASSTGEPMRPGYESSSEVFSSRNPSPAHSRTSGYSGKGPSPKVHSIDETRVERGRSPSRGCHGVDEERIELVRSPAKAPRHEVRVERVRSPSPVCHERMEPFCSPSVTRGQERSPGVDTLLDYDEKGLSDDFPKGFSGSSPEHSCEDDELLASPPRPHLTPLPVDSPKDNPGRVGVICHREEAGSARTLPPGDGKSRGFGRAIRVLLRPLVMRTVVGCDVPGVRRCPPLIRKVLSGWTRIMSRTWILCYGIPARLWTRMERTSRWWVRTYRPSRCWFPRFLSWTHLLLRPVRQGSRHQILNLPWGNLWIWWSLPRTSPLSRLSPSISGETIQYEIGCRDPLRLEVRDGGRRVSIPDGRSHQRKDFSHDSRRNSRSRSRSPLRTESSSRRTSRSARSRRERRHSQSSTSRQRVSDDDGSDIMVSPSRYSIFRNAVRTSRGAYTSVNPRGEGLAKASMVHLSQDDKPEKVAWSVQPQLRHAIDHVSMLAQGVKKIDKVAKTPLCEHTFRESSFKFLKPNEVFDRKENFRLKVDPDSDFPIKPPHLDGSLGSFTMPASFNVPAACVSASEELSRRAAVYGSIADVMFSSIIHSLAPEDERAPLLKERITIAAEASMRSITASVAVASNMQLVRRDVVLDHLLLNQSSASRARTAPFSGTHLMGPDPNRFYEEIMKLREQQVLHGGLSANFRNPAALGTETKEAIKDQITELRDQILKPMATKIHELETRIAGMERKTTNYVNKDAHTHTQKQMDSLEVKIKTIENDLKKLKDDSNSPSSTVDRGNNFYNTVINQTAKINNLVIAGLKEPTEHAEDESEEPEDIKAQVMTLAASLKCSISSNFQVHRLGSKRKSARPVLVEFANQWDRRKLFVASRGTAIKDAGLKNIFVNEDLDKKQAALYFLTRQAKKTQSDKIYMDIRGHCQYLRRGRNCPTWLRTTSASTCAQPATVPS